MKEKVTIWKYRSSSSSITIPIIIEVIEEHKHASKVKIIKLIKPPFLPYKEGMIFYAHNKEIITKTIDFFDYYRQEDDLCKFLLEPDNSI